MRGGFRGSIQVFRVVTDRRGTARNRAEYRTRIDEVRIGDDSFIECCPRLRDDGSMRRCASPGGTRLGVALPACPSHRRRPRFVLRPRCPAAELAHPLRRRSARVEHLADGHTDVEPDRVGELDQSHGHSEFERRPSTVPGDPLVDTAHRRHQVRREDPFTKAGAFTGSGKRSICQTTPRPIERGAGLAAVHDLDQHHLRDRIKK
jgi:hypothetical protein